MDSQLCHRKIWVYRVFDDVDEDSRDSWWVWLWCTEKSMIGGVVSVMGWYKRSFSEGLLVSIEAYEAWFKFEV